MTAPQLPEARLREIEAALTEYGALCFLRAGPAKTKPVADNLLAMIRAKLPAADAEHDAKVEAWDAEATRISIHCGVAMQLVQRMRDDGVRLMRARPAATVEPHSFTGTDRTYADLVGREKAAGELLRAAKDAANWLLECDQDDDAQKLYEAIEAAERAGVTP